jgi:hypothetical protein
VLGCSLLIGVPAQAVPFVNLDFEQATVIHTDPDFPPAIDAAAAFPGWTSASPSVRYASTSRGLSLRRNAYSTRFW